MAATKAYPRLHVAQAGLSVWLLLSPTVDVRGEENLPPGRPDEPCINECAARGFEESYCERVCWVPLPPGPNYFSEVTDWSCLTACASRGGKYSDCKPRCRVR